MRTRSTFVSVGVRSFSVCLSPPTEGILNLAEPGRRGRGPLRPLFAGTQCVVDLAELGRRVPRGALNLYLVDLSGHEIAGLERDQIGPFDVGRVANAPVVVIPLQRVEDLRLLLQELENQGRAEEESRATVAFQYCSAARESIGATCCGLFLVILNEPKRQRAEN